MPLNPLVLGNLAAENRFQGCCLLRGPDPAPCYSKSLVTNVQRHQATTRTYPEIDKTSASYLDYLTKLTTWRTLYANLETKVDFKQKRLETLQQDLFSVSSQTNTASEEFGKAYDELIKVLDTKIALSTSALNTAKYTNFKTQIQNLGQDDWDEIGFLLEHIANQEPFTLTDIDVAIQQYQIAFDAYTQLYTKERQKSREIVDYDSSTHKVMIDPTIGFTNTNLLDVQRVEDLRVGFAIYDPTSTSTPPATLGTGHVILNMFMTKREVVITAQINDFLGVFTPINPGDILSINTSGLVNIFKYYHPTEFKWITGKNGKIYEKRKICLSISRMGYDARCNR